MTSRGPHYKDAWEVLLVILYHKIAQTAGIHSRRFGRREKWKVL